jgi:hypothetical protein
MFVCIAEGSHVQGIYVSFPYGSLQPEFFPPWFAPIDNNAGNVNWGHDTIHSSPVD